MSLFGLRRGTDAKTILDGPQAQTMEAAVAPRLYFFNRSPLLTSHATMGNRTLVLHQWQIRLWGTQ